MNAIHLETVTKSFGDLIAVNKVSLEVREGEVYGLLGPNGAGKTTLISLLVGLLRPDAGTIRVLGRDLAREASEVKRSIGIVPQELAIYDDLTAVENVRFFAGLYGLRGATLAGAAAEALEMAGLAEHARGMPRKFSGGMRRRLNIACAVAHRPRLVIMDEPTVGIDPQSRHHILASVKAMAASGRTVLYTSHYMEEVEEVAGRLAVLDHGKVIATGTPEDLVGLVTESTVLTFTVRDPARLPADGLRALPGVRNVEVVDTLLRVEADRSDPPLEAIIAALGTSGAGIRAIQTRTPDLETVFLSLTGRSLRDGQA